MATTFFKGGPLDSEFLTAAPAVITVNDRPALAFDAATDENAYWSDTCPQGFTGTATCIISYIMASATTGSVRFQAAIEAVTDADATDLDATTSFDTANSAGDTVPGTAGYLGQFSITMTNQDSLTAGDYFRLRLNRDADGTSGTDDASGDCYVLAVEMQY